MLNLFSKDKQQSSPKRKRVGLALGGGVARGMAHIGIIKAFEDNNIPIDYVVGVSAGSLVGGLYAAGMDINKIRSEAEKLTWGTFSKFHVSRKGMFSSRPVADLVRKHVGNVKFKDLKIPFAATATDILTGEGVILNDPDLELADAIRASSTFPGVYAPVKIGQRYLIDGGAAANVPSAFCREMGAEVVIAVDVIPKIPLKKLPNHIALIIDRGVDLLLHNISQRMVQEADLVLTPVREHVHSFHIRKSGLLIEMGLREVYFRIKDIKELIGIE